MFWARFWKWTHRIRPEVLEVDLQDSSARFKYIPDHPEDPLPELPA